MGSQLNTAVVLFIFKRPNQVASVFQAIAAAKPIRLYIIADGPRDSEEKDLCKQTRQVVEHVHWDCEVQRDYSDVNLGVERRVISGLDWVFEHEERAIIFEDDCLPDPSFFRFCEELLQYYENDPQVMHISGDNFLQGKRTFSTSYYFSKYPHGWGWATWRRAWTLFHQWDADLTKLELNGAIFRTRSEQRFWEKLLNQLRSGDKGCTWDYQWALICFALNALCVMPAHNLISNIGFGVDATHTLGYRWYGSLPTFPMPFPLTHPREKRWDSEADEHSARIFFNAKPALWIRLIEKLREYREV